jgi:phosphinothricin acetyltransferase
MSEAALRLAAPADFEAIAAITNHYIRTTAIHFGDCEVTAAELRASWREHADLYPWLVADLSGEVIGYAKAGSFRARAAYRWTTETGIYLAFDQRGRRLGTRLYARLCQTLRAQGFHAAIGGIALPNDASVRLHERLGFVHCGTVPRAGRKFDRWHDVGFWHLALQPADHVPGAITTPADGLRASRSAGEP